HMRVTSTAEVKPDQYAWGLRPADDDDAVAGVIVDEVEHFGHPQVEAVAGVLGDLAHDVDAVLEPGQLGAGRGREDRDLAILASVAVLHRHAPSRRKRKGPRFR